MAVVDTVPLDEYDITCAICLDIFLRPKVLPCGHMFCSHCIFHYVGEKKGFNCPLCRKLVTQDVRNLPVNQELTECLCALGAQRSTIPLAVPIKEAPEPDEVQLQKEKAMKEEEVNRNWIYYVPKSGDSLNLLAIRHDTTVEKIKLQNKLLTSDLDLLPAGRALVLPKVKNAPLPPPPENPFTILQAKIKCLVKASCSKMTESEAKYYLSCNNEELREAFKEWKEDYEWERQQGQHASATMEGSTPSWFTPSTRPTVYKTSSRNAKFGDLLAGSSSTTTTTTTTTTSATVPTDEPKVESKPEVHSCEASSDRCINMNDSFAGNTSFDNWTLIDYEQHEALPVSPISNGTNVTCSAVFDKCNGCSKSFGILLRRHHCRQCTKVFCNTCSSMKVPLKGHCQPVRVCVDCGKSLMNKLAVESLNK